MDLNFTNLLGSSRYKLAKNTNTNVQLGLEQKTKPLTEYDIIDIVNQQNVFEDERKKSGKYRLNGRFNIYTVNSLNKINVNPELTPPSGAWDPEFYGAPPIPTNWVMQITYPSDMDSNFLIEKRQDQDSKFDVLNQNPTPQTIKSNAYRGLQFESLGVTITNGDICLTINGIQNHNIIDEEYVYLYSNTEYNPFHGIHKVRNAGISGSGLTKDLTLYTIVASNLLNVNLPVNPGNFVRIVEPSFNDLNFNNASNIISVTSSDISGNTTGSFSNNEIRYATIETSLDHDLLINDFVDIRTGSVSTLNGVWRVYNVISTTKFVIKINDPTTPATVDSVKGTNITYSTTFPKWRRLDGTPSEYYVRKFEVLTSNDYTVYPCAFSSNIYSDITDPTIGTANKTWLFQFNQDVSILRLEDNRKGPITNLYYTVIKRAGMSPYQWSSVNADWEFNKKTTNTGNGLEYISLYNSSSNGTIEKPTPRTEFVDSNGELNSIPGSKYIGDFTEYNSLLLREITITEVIHRFGLNSSPDSSGYYYKPFKKLEIRKYSNIIETAGPNDIIVDIPNNYETYSDGSIAWRDLLPIGYYEEGVNGVTYPFLNGSNYFYFNYNLYVRRQNPIILIDQSGVNYIKNITGECI